MPPVVAQAAMDTGVARKPIADMDAYGVGSRPGSTRPAALQNLQAGAASSKRVVFAEGEEHR